MIDALMIISGLLLLFRGGEWLVHSSISIARRMGLSTLLVSLVVVGFGTSAPELLVSVQAALAGASDIALGNVVGSNIANILLILGIGAVFSAIHCQKREVLRDVIAVTVASLILAILSFTGLIDRLVGIGFIVLLAGYLFYCIRKGQHMPEIIHENFTDMSDFMPLKKAVPFAVFSLATVVIGAKLLVTGAVYVARDFGISEAVIGLTIVAVGTSLPELATAIAAARKKETDIIIGNVLGSNLFNILAILGITAVITDIPFRGQIATYDVWIMLLVSILLMAIVLWRKAISRNSGYLFLILYAVYMGWLAFVS